MRAAAALLVPLTLLAAALAVDVRAAPQAAPPPRPLAAAPDGDDPKKPGDDEEEERRRKEAEAKAVRAELEAIAKDFREQRTSALLDRWPKGKVELKLGVNDGSVARKQAQGWFEKWYENRTVTKAVLKTVEGLSASFDLQYRNDKRNELQHRKLRITIARRGGDEDAGGDGEKGFELRALKVE